MLELEKTNNMEVQIKYYYHNLSKKSQKEIADTLGTGFPGTFEKFKQETRNKQLNHYDLLIELWKKYEQRSVAGRGHGIHDCFAMLIVLGYWIVVLGYCVTQHWPLLN